jgi:hypothetical protein
MTRKLWLSLTGLALALASTQPAYSTFDYKIHAGSLCQPSKGNEAVYFIRGPGYLFHTNAGAPQPLLVNCPIVRDRVPHWGAPGERTDIDAGIHFNYLGKEEEITCRFFALNENGSQVTAGGLLPTQTVNDPNQQILSFYWLVKPQDTAIDGSYAIQCGVPAFVFILRYVVGEDKSTDEGGF